MQRLEADFSSREDEADDYDIKKEEDSLSSSNSVLQEEIFQNSNESIIEQKSLSLEIDQNAPLYDEDIKILDLELPDEDINISVEPPGEDIKVLDLDQHQLIHFIRYSNL